MYILVVGVGYVGLVTGACFAEMGHHVVCLDIDQAKIARLVNGEIPIYEPGLEEIVKRNIASGRLEFTTDYAKGVEGAKFCFLAVPTPAAPGGACDLSYLKKAIEAIASHAKRQQTLVIKSTVPVGTAAQAKAWFEVTNTSVTCEVVSNPEFLKEGDAVQDFMKPDRILIGTKNPTVAAAMKELYAPFNVNHDRIIVMDNASAEVTKYAANAMLATRISFVNELAWLCEEVGADITEVRKGMGADRRIGYSFLYAGVGYGGSCFPKDVQALQAMARQYGCSAHIVNAAEAVNRRQKKVLFEKLQRYFDERGGLKDKTIAIWGLAFKPGTDDMREASSCALIEDLLAAGALVRLFDPVAMNAAQAILPKDPAITWCKDELQASQGADAIALVTEWKQFRFLDFSLVLQEMVGCAFFDGRNQYSPEEMAAKGFDYFSIGRAPKLGQAEGIDLAGESIFCPEVSAR